MQITQWVGEAHERLQHPNYHGFLRNRFEKTGCLITADGSTDCKIKPEGLHEFNVIPPLDTPGPEKVPDIDAPEPAEDLENTSADIYDSEDASADDLDLETEDSDETENIDDVKMIDSTMLKWSVKNLCLV